MSTRVVTVLFEVDVAEQQDAERIVEDRLLALPILQQNDATDTMRGTIDPVVTYAVVPASRLLEEAF